MYRLSHATVPAPAVYTCIIVDVIIAGAPARALVDTGANASFMSDDFVKSVGIACDTRNAHSASLADGTSVGITGCTPKLQRGNAEMYRRSGRVISREQGLRYDAGFAVPVLMS